MISSFSPKKSAWYPNKLFDSPKKSFSGSPSPKSIGKQHFVFGNKGSFALIPLGEIEEYQFEEKEDAW